MLEIDNWLIAICIYIILIFTTFIPILIAVFKRVKLHPGGQSFDDSSHFTDNAKKHLSQHFSRLEGTLLFWKNEAEKYKRLHYYTVFWTIPSLVVIPILAQVISGNSYSKIFLTIVSAHTAILLSFHRGLKVERNFRAFRQGESEFYDVYRRFLDRPTTFGSTEDEQLNNYFDATENIRKYVRNAEIDNFPTIEEIKSQMSDETAVPAPPRAKK